MKSKPALTAVIAATQQQQELYAYLLEDGLYLDPVVRRSMLDRIEAQLGALWIQRRREKKARI